MDPVRWPGGSRRFLLYVTIRPPLAASIPSPHVTPGAAVREDEKDKLRYCGAGALPLAVEQGGQLGAGAPQALITLRRESADFGPVRTDATRVSGLCTR